MTTSALRRRRRGVLGGVEGGEAGDCDLGAAAAAAARQVKLKKRAAGFPDV